MLTHPTIDGAYQPVGSGSNRLSHIWSRHWSAYWQDTSRQLEWLPRLLFTVSTLPPWECQFVQRSNWNCKDAHSYKVRSRFESLSSLMSLWSYVAVPKLISAGATDSVALNTSIGVLFLNVWKLITMFVIGVLLHHLTLIYSVSSSTYTLPD